MLVKILFINIPLSIILFPLPMLIYRKCIHLEPLSGFKAKLINGIWTLIALSLSFLLTQASVLALFWHYIDYRILTKSEYKPEETLLDRLEKNEQAKELHGETVFKDSEIDEIKEKSENKTTVVHKEKENNKDLEPSIKIKEEDLYDNDTIRKIKEEDFFDNDVINNIKNKSKLENQNEKSETNSHEVCNHKIKAPKKEKGFYFEDITEFKQYVKYNNEESVVWLKGNQYKEHYIKGYQLFEQRKYQLAINEYLKALEYNPVGISARFEICEAYLATQMYDNALSALNSLKIYLAENDKIAKYYRRLGYIYTEKEEYELAYACYKHSLLYEKNEIANNEMEYISSVSGENYNMMDEDDILRKNKIFFI